MAKIELTLEQARSQSANFMYVFASDKFLSLIPQKHAAVIRNKRANQKKLLMLSADEYLGSMDRYSEYVQAVRTGFEETYGMSPAQALEKLALGQEVAGKNWDEGVYGIGELYPTVFKAITIGDQVVSVDKETGHIFVGSEDITDTTKTVYGVVKKQAKALQLFSHPQTAEGYIFMSQYNKTGKRYVAKSYAGSDGIVKNGRTGNDVSASESATVWGNIQLGTGEFLSWVKELLSIIGIKLPNLDITGGNDPEQINATNTLPNQKADGFVTEAGIGEAGAILLALAGGGLLLASAKKKKSKNNK